MGMSPGNQAITGGTVLRTPAIQSPNYVPGVSGWIVRIDGSAEFNNGTFRGSIEVGPLSGAHFIVNNPATGDVVDVYNSSAQLVFSIDANGNATSYAPGSSGDPYVQLTNGTEVFNHSTGFTSPDPPAISAPTITSGSTELQLYSGTPDGNVNHASVLALFGGTSGAGAEARLTQRGVTGDAVQIDSSNNTGQLLHVASYTGTTNAGGGLVLPHGAAFTPTQCLITGTAPGGSFANLTWGQDGIGSTTFTTNWHIANTGAAFANSVINFDALFIG